MIHISEGLWNIRFISLFNIKFQSTKYKNKLKTEMNHAGEIFDVSKVYKSWPQLVLSAFFSLLWFSCLIKENWIILLYSLLQYYSKLKMIKKQRNSPIISQSSLWGSLCYWQTDPVHEKIGQTQTPAKQWTVYFRKQLYDWCLMISE